MATIENIRRKIKSLEMKWLKIKDRPLSLVTAKQDSLAKGLERVRASIERYFRMNPHEKKQCKALLGSLLEISENLKSSYLCPAAYTESFDIFDTIKDMDKRSVVWKSWSKPSAFFYFYSTNSPFSKWMTWSAKRRIVGSCSIIKIVSHFSRKDLSTHNNLEISSGCSQTVGSSRK